MDDDLLDTLHFKVKELHDEQVAGHYQIVSCTAVVPPSVRVIEFENYAYTMEQIEQMGQQTIDADSRMKGFKIKIAVV